MCRYRLELLALLAPLVLAAGMLLCRLKGAGWYVALLDEDGPVEMLTVLFLLIAAGTAMLASLRCARSGERVEAIVLAVGATVLLLGAGDELSWGQRNLQFPTPPQWRALSDQPDVTLHNIAQRQLQIKTKHVIGLWLALATLASLVWFVLPLPPTRSPGSAIATRKEPPSLLRWWPPGWLVLISIAGTLASMDYPTGWEEEAGELLASMWLCFWLLGCYSGNARCEHAHTFATNRRAPLPRVQTPPPELHHAAPTARRDPLSYLKNNAAGLAVLAILIALGLTATVANRGLPIVRNSLVYARTASHIADHGWRLWEVCPRPDLAYNKACGFPFVSSVFVDSLGPSTGLRVVSFAATIAFLLASWATACRFGGAFKVERGWIPAQLAIVGLNPLVLYQFWSAYPDTLFSTACLLSILALDRLLQDDQAHPLGWTLAYLSAVFATILVKHQGLMMVACQSLYFVAMTALPRGGNGTGRVSRGALLYLGGTATLLCALLLTMVTGDSLNINESFSGHASEMFKDPLSGMAQYALWLIVSFHLFLLPAATGVVALLRRDLDRRLVAVTAMAGGWMLLNGISSSGSYNMRYYLWMTPFIALAAARGCRQWQARWRPQAVFVGMSVGLVFALGYNFAPMWVAYGKDTDKLLRSISRTDNLRMGEHLRMGAALAKICKTVPAGGTLVFAADYYYASDASHHIYERDGFLRSDVTVEYVTRYHDVTTQADDYWLYRGLLVRGRNPIELPGAVSVQSLGSDLFHVTRR